MRGFVVVGAIFQPQRTEMPLKFLDSRNPSVFITTPNVGGTGLNVTAANNGVITQKLWVLNDQWQAFAWGVRLGQNWVPHTWLLNTGPGGCDNRACDLHQYSGVAQMRVLHSLMSWPNITMWMTYQILEACENHSKRLTKNGNTLASNEPLIL